MTPRKRYARTFALLAGLAGLPAAVIVGATACAEALAATKPKRPGAPAQSLPARKAFVATPGSDAEYLLLADRYTLRDDGAVVHERRSRLQVNSYLAINRKYGESKVEYDPAVDTFEVVENRTALPSGQTVDAPANAMVDDQPPAAEHDPLWGGLRRKVIVHTALEPGAVIEEAWRVTRAKGDLPWLEFSAAIMSEPPIRRREIVVDLPSGAPFRWQATAGFGDAPGHETKAGRDLWIWRFDAVPAFPPEPGGPAKAPFVIATTCPSREALAVELGRRAGSGAADPEGLVELAKRAAAKEPGDEARILAVLDAVGQAVTVAPITPSEQSWRPRTLAQVWSAGVATPLEVALLQAAALRSVGFSGVSAAVRGAQERDIDKCPAMSGLDRALLAVRWGGDGMRFYDPVAPAEGGPLEATTATRSVLAVTTAEGTPGILVWPTADGRTVRLALDVAPDGGVGGSLDYEATGGSTPHAALVRNPEQVARELAAILPEGKAGKVRVTELRRNGASLVAEVEGKLPDKNALGLVALALADIPGGAGESLPPLPEAGRLTPIVLPSPCIRTVELTVGLPGGWKVEALPVAARIANDAGVVVTAARILPDGRLQIERRIELRSPRIGATIAGQLRALLVSWRSPASRELILRPPAVPQAGKAPPLARAGAS